MDPVARGDNPLVRHHPPPLFDLEADLRERKNLAVEKPEIVAQLLQEMRKLLPAP